MDNITIVSGYWNINSKFSHNKYDEWFNNTLKINQRYIFFCDKSNNEYINKFRSEYETIFVDSPIDNLFSRQFYKDNWTNPTHVPSPELGMIWHEKIHCMKLAKDNDQNPTDFYVWVDAGVCIYRDNKPPNNRLNLIDTNMLPHDKLCYSYVKDDNHNFAATVLIMHKSIIDRIHDIYFEYLIKLGEELNDWRCGSDQVIHTKMLLDYPELYHKFSEGYGENLVELYKISRPKKIDIPHKYLHLFHR